MDTLGFIGTSADLNAIGKLYINKVLVFRGTLPWDIKNWISDINFVVTNYPICDNSKISFYLRMQGSSWILLCFFRYSKTSYGYS